MAEQRVSEIFCPSFINWGELNLSVCINKVRRVQNMVIVVNKIQYLFEHYNNPYYYFYAGGYGYL